MFVSKVLSFNIEFIKGTKNGPKTEETPFPPKNIVQSELAYRLK